MGDFDTDTLTINGDFTVSGTVQADQFVDSSGDRVIGRETDGTVHIGANSFIFADSTVSSNGADMMYSSVNNLQLGNSSNHVTTVQGTLVAPNITGVSDPTSSTDAANRRYVDRIGALSAVLDTRLPAYGSSHRVSLNTANIHSENAVGFSYVGRNDAIRDRVIDYSVGIANSGSETMAKASVGFSW
jgi:hypothetical protein